MQPLDLEILPLTDANPHDDLYSCAKIINRRQLFEPNRLRDEGRHEEERIAARVASIRNYLSQPGSSAYYARSKRLDEIIGWIGWLRPHVNHQSSAEFSNEKEEIDNKVDNEKDMDAIKSVSVERKALECEFFANEPFW